MPPRLCHPAPGQTRRVGRGCYSVRVSRISVLLCPGLECLHLSVDQQDRVGIVLLYQFPHDPVLFLLGLMNLSSIVLLKSLWLLYLGDFSIHAEVAVAESVLKFVDIMTFIDLSQCVKGPYTCGGAYTQSGVHDWAGR